LQVLQTRQNDDFLLGFFIAFGLDKKPGTGLPLVFASTAAFCPKHLEHLPGYRLCAKLS